ncbi:MAG: hypothetical protein ACI4VH_04715 [Clostridia bacterium]
MKRINLFILSIAVLVVAIVSLRNTIKIKNIEMQLNNIVAMEQGDYRN